MSKKRKKSKEKRRVVSRELTREERIALNRKYDEIIKKRMKAERYPPELMIYICLMGLFVSFMGLNFLLLGIYVFNVYPPDEMISRLSLMLAILLFICVPVFVYDSRTELKGPFAATIWGIFHFILTYFIFKLSPFKNIMTVYMMEIVSIGVIIIIDFIVVPIIRGYKSEKQKGDETVYKFIFYPKWQFDILENKLSQIEENGYRLIENKLLYFFKFKKVEPKKVKYVCIYTNPKRSYRIANEKKYISSLGYLIKNDNRMIRYKIYRCSNLLDFKHIRSGLFKNVTYCFVEVLLIDLFLLIPMLVVIFFQHQWNLQTNVYALMINYIVLIEIRFLYNLIMLFVHFFRKNK